MRFQRMNLLFKARPDPKPKTRRVLGAHTGIFIHMKQLNRFPIHRLRDQRFHQRELRVASSGNHAGASVLFDGARDERGGSFRRGCAQAGARGVNFEFVPRQA